MAGIQYRNILKNWALHVRDGSKSRVNLLERNNSTKVTTQKVVNISGSSTGLQDIKY